MRLALGGTVIERDVPPEAATTVRVPLPPGGSQDDMRLTFSSYTVIPAIRTKPGQATRHIGIGLIAIRLVGGDSPAEE